MCIAGIRRDIRKSLEKCPIFDGSNYHEWKFKIQTILQVFDYDLWFVTEQGLTELCKMSNAEDIHKYTCLDALATCIITYRLSSNEFRDVMHLQNAKLIWDHLADVYDIDFATRDKWFEDVVKSFDLCISIPLRQ
jgi:hypothetical protein